MNKDIGKKILIIGKNGFVGRNLSEHYKDACIVSSTELNLLSENDVRDFFEKEFFDVVIDTAIFNPAYVSYEEKKRELEYDLRMFHNIAKCNRLYGKLIYFGSGAEYDKRYPICTVSEQDLLNSNERCSGLIPETMYGQAKYIIGQEIESGIYGSDNIYNLRIFGLFGKYENWKTTFISGACCKAMNDLPITIRQNVFFDYLYIDDFCKMIDDFISIEKPDYHTYNITSGRRISLTEISDIVIKVSGKDVPVIVCKEGLANEYTASNERLLKQIGGFSFTSYEESIKALYDWYEYKRDSVDILSLLYQ